MNLLVCGAAGFIGSNFVRHRLETHPEDRIVVLDALTYAGNLSTLADVRDRIEFIPGRIQDRTSVRGILEDHKITHLVNFAAETHNDRSILETDLFIETNCLGTHVLLELTREFGIEKLVHVSTDEVYGSIREGAFTEASPLEPNTPYSASKAAGDLMCRAHFTTYKTPVVVTRGGNNYGPYQYPEKLIPFFIVRLLQGKKVPLYGDGSQSREWIHAMDHCRAISLVLERGEPGTVYNIGTDQEVQNRVIVDQLLAATGRGPELVRSIPDPRKGAHDWRYSMTTDRVRALGWEPEHQVEEEIPKVVDWYRKNEGWWRPIIEHPEYVRFVQRFYGPGLGEDL